MSQIKIEANPSGGGIYTLQSGAGSTDRTITLPDKAGEVAVGAGTVVQAKYSSTSATFTNTLSTSSNIHSGLSITPTSTSNKILVTAGFQLVKNSAGTQGAVDGNGFFFACIYRDTTQLQEIANGAGYFLPRDSRQAFAAQELDSPSTTSSITYYIKPSSVLAGGSNTFVCHDVFLSLLEIVA